MGLLNSEPCTWLNISKGFLENKKKNIHSHGYEGLLIGIERKLDTFEEKEISKIVLTMADTDPSAKGQKVKIQFTEDAWFANGFFGRIRAVDIAKPFTVGVSQSDKNEKVSFCWIKQSGSTIKRDDKYPQPEKVTVGKQDIMDWTGVTECNTSIIEEIQHKIGANASGGDLPF